MWVSIMNFQTRPILALILFFEKYIFLPVDWLKYLRPLSSSLLSLSNNAIYRQTYSASWYPNFSTKSKLNDSMHSFTNYKNDGNLRENTLIASNWCVGEYFWSVSDSTTTVKITSYSYLFYKNYENIYILYVSLANIWFLRFLRFLKLSILSRPAWINSGVTGKFYFGSYCYYYNWSWFWELNVYSTS